MKVKIEFECTTGQELLSLINLAAKTFTDMINDSRERGSVAEPFSFSCGQSNIGTVYASAKNVTTNELLKNWLVPGKYMPYAERRKKLLKLFTLDGKPYVLRYEWHKDYHKADQPTLMQMTHEKLIRVLGRDTKWITYQLTQAGEQAASNA